MFVKSIERVSHHISSDVKLKIRSVISGTTAGRSFISWYMRGSKPSKNDSARIFLISYPKCGRTWLRLMIGKALALNFHIEDANPLRLNRLAKTYSEIPRINIVHDDNPHWKTPVQLLKSKEEYRGKKVILLVRDVRDVVVSMYFQVAKRDIGYRGEISSFLREPTGSLDTILAFYKIWYENLEVPEDVLLVRYEDIHEDAERELRRVLDFIGVSDVSDEAVREAVLFSSFDNMRQMEVNDDLDSGMLRPGNGNDEESFKTRKGKVGGYVEYFNEEDLRYLDEKVTAELPSYFGYR